MFFNMKDRKSERLIS
ncbi:hypothetical protein DDB_G0294356 [Dictyostelium discoideum AX4]|nr:hypothetical protein DDB_G0294356 [Dictyostelium discoideum AX4]EAL60306.1 hypothetical protein DDB_G0294356 [Dictyostelium discoideum AX4]|eukprot:XP_628719.1 hypothetical protein DDB_G0294356 [Dictyostelium discoideum AX4]